MNIINAMMAPTWKWEKSFKCDQCDKYFAEQSSLVCHKITHSGKNPYQCDKCDKSFARKSDQNYKYNL